jgi:hypothetical protein
MIEIPQNDPRIGVALSILSTVALDKNPIATRSVARLRDEAAEFLSTYLKNEPTKTKGNK